MPLDALATIMQYESGGKNIQQQVVDPSISTASGYFQITNSTWNSSIVPSTGLPRVGPGTAYPQGAMDLSYDQQAQGASALFKAQGFQPWTCTGCNPALAQYVADQGGASAFALTGDNALTTGPVTSDEALGSPAISFTASGGASSATMPSVSDIPGPLSKPFTWLYDQTVSATEQVIAADISAMQSAVGSYIEPLLVLALVALGIRALFGRYLIEGYARFVLMVAIIVPFVAVGSSFYQTYVVDPVLGFPSWWQDYLATGNNIKLSGNGPAAMLDAVYNQIYHVITEIWKATPLSFSMFWNAVALAGAWVVSTFSLLAVFVAYAIITLLARVLLVLGPVMIPFVLFRFTAGMFFGWARAAITLVLTMLAIDVILTMYLSIMTNLMSALTITGTPETDLPSVWGCALALAVMGWSVIYIPRLMALIGGGVSVSLNSVSRHMSGAAVTSIAMAPVNMARRFVGMR